MNQVEKNLRSVVRKIISEAPRKQPAARSLPGDPDGRAWIERVKAEIAKRELPAEGGLIKDFLTRDEFLLALAGALPAGSSIDINRLNNGIVYILKAAGQNLLRHQKFIDALESSSFGAMLGDKARAKLNELIIRTCGAVVGEKDLVGQPLGPEERANIRAIIEHEYLLDLPQKSAPAQAQTTKP